MDEDRKSNKILVADDTEFFRVILGDILKAEGYDVLLAADGDETLNLIKQHRDDIRLLIIDIVMPALSGQEVLEQLQRENFDRHFPVLIMTGFKQNPDEITKLRDLGIEGFISKTEPPRFFVARIRQVLEKTSTESASVDGDQS